MQKLFNKILVPVDFSAGSKKLLEKAVEMAGQYHCSIQLLHVVTSPSLSAASVSGEWVHFPHHVIANKEELEIRMEKLCSFIYFLGNEQAIPAYSIVRGTWDEAIIDCVNQHKIDLVLVGQPGWLFSNRKMTINPDKVAVKTNIPVISLPSSRHLTKLCSIVIPVTDFLPLRKLIYGVYLATAYNSTLKLLGIENSDTKTKVEYYLTKAYGLVSDHCNVPVELEMVTGDNIAAAVNLFANTHATDLVIVNPGTQTKMPGLFSSFFGRILQKYSAPPVLTISAV
jgi:nucleotide-binding universal stress UspA family protein